jgi:flagellar biosynthetic protein FliR
MAFSLPLAAGFMLVLFRAAGLCVAAPLFGTRSIPAQVRMAVALALAVVAFLAAGAPRFEEHERLDLLVVAVLRESLIGIGAGLAARFAVEAAAAAAHAIGLGMGLSFGATIDPLHGAESTALADLLAFLALGVAIGAGLHREAVAWLCRSVAAMPPGTPVPIPELAAIVVGEAARAAALAMRLAVPVLAAVTFGHMALGVVGRAVPQMGLANVGFSVAILAGGGAIYLAAPGLAEMAAQAAHAAFAGR